MVKPHEGVCGLSVSEVLTQSLILDHIGYCAVTKYVKHIYGLFQTWIFVVDTSR
jgi:hypothetical protein